MGYEIKLIIGKEGHPSTELKHEDQAILDGNLAYFPIQKDKKGNFIETGRVEVYFQVYAMVDLSKPGIDCHLLKLDWKNTDTRIVWYFYEDGNTQVKQDDYGDLSKPIPVADVITALKKDFKESLDKYPGFEGDPDSGGYRRFKWAIALLKVMDTNTQVLLHGH